MGEILLSGHKVERRSGMSANIVHAVSRRNKWGQLGEILGGVRNPWSWFAASRLMIPIGKPGVGDK